MRSFGKKGQVYFDTEEEFYFTLGFLAKSSRTEIRWEHNEEQGAWGSEGRIHCSGNTDNYPLPLRRAFTAGNGSIKFRVNCNDYIHYIVGHHNFVEGNRQDISLIRQTIPEQYLDAFDRGSRLVV